MQNNRIEWIDMTKFWAIFFVVLLHFGTFPKLDQYFHLFHMPIFYFLSGLCFSYEKHKKIGEFICGRLKSLIVPYFAFSILFYLIWSVIYFFYDKTYIVDAGTYLEHLLIYNTDTIINLWGSIQWFLTSLLFVELIFYFIYFICRISINKHIRGILCVLVSTIGFFLPVFLNVRLPLALDTSLAMLIFYSIGNWCRDIDFSNKIENLDTKYTVFSIVWFAIISTLVFLLNGSSNVRCIEFGNPILYIIGATAGILMVILFSKLCLIISKKIKLNYKFLTYLGKNTIIILYIHRLFDGIDKTFIIPNLSFSSFAINI